MKKFRGEPMPNGNAKILVLEIEKIQLFRKKCRAHLRFCRDCQRTTDFISLAEAASLFDVYLPILFQFIQKNAGHYANDSAGNIFVCVYSFLVCVNEKTKNSKIKMIERQASADSDADIEMKPDEKFPKIHTCGKK